MFNNSKVSKLITIHIRYGMIKIYKAKLMNFINLVFIIKDTF